MIRRLRNLGPASEAMLARAGIVSPDQLRVLGAVAAYVAVRRVEPTASLNLLWAIEGALQDRDWRDISREARLSLLMALDEIAGQQGRPDNKRLAASARDRGLVRTQ